SYNISIKHPKGYTAVSNMPVQKQNMDENNMQWTRFKTTPLMPDYFIAAIVAHLTVISESRTIKLWCRTNIIRHVQFAYIIATHIAQFLDNVFLNIRKSPETNHIVIQKLLGEEDIKFRFVLYGEEDIIYNEKIDFEIRKIEITRVIGYKVVHEWFYNGMDPYKW
ncbi:Laeverin, partial [Camponotus floridanus]